MKLMLAAVALCVVASVAPARADEGRVCNVITFATPGKVLPTEEMVSKCQKDDILVITQGPEGVYPVYAAYIADYCRLDLQFFYDLNGKMLICVYRGNRRELVTESKSNSN